MSNKKSTIKQTNNEEKKNRDYKSEILNSKEIKEHREKCRYDIKHQSNRTRITMENIDIFQRRSDAYFNSKKSLKDKIDYIEWLERNFETNLKNELISEEILDETDVALENLTNAVKSKCDKSNKNILFRVIDEHPYISAATLGVLGISIIQCLRNRK